MADRPRFSASLHEVLFVSCILCCILMGSARLDGANPTIHQHVNALNVPFTVVEDVTVVLVNFDASLRDAVSASFDSNPQRIFVGAAETSDRAFPLPIVVHDRYTVVHSSAGVFDQLRAAMNSTIQNQRVSASAVEAVLDPLWSSGFTLFVLNMAGVVPGEYLYSGDAPGCAFNHWIAKEGLFAVLDVTAGSPDVVPVVGDGALLSAAFPHLGPSDSTVPTLYGSRLAAFIQSSTRKLLCSPLSSLRLPTEVLTVRAVVVRDGDGSGGAADWDAITAAVDAVSLPGQRVVFDVQDLRLDECAWCAATLQAAIVNYYNPATRHDDRVLDAQEAVKWLRLTQPSLFADTPGVLHVFVADLSSDIPVLVDRRHKAVISEGIVVAVQTQAGLATEALSCRGRKVVTDSRDISAAVLASLLQMAYALQSPDVAFDAHHAVFRTDYVWAFQNVAGGLLTAAVGTSRLAARVAVRNAVFALVHTAKERLRSVLSTAIEDRVYTRFTSELSHVDDFMHRLATVVVQLQRGQKPLALSSAKALHEDVAALQAALASEHLTATRDVVCPDEVPTDGMQTGARLVTVLWGSVALVLLFAMCCTRSRPNRKATHAD